MQKRQMVCRHPEKMRGRGNKFPQYYLQIWQRYTRCNTEHETEQSQFLEEIKDPIGLFRTPGVTGRIWHLPLTERTMFITVKITVFRSKRRN